jgi:hypothetical protein
MYVVQVDYLKVNQSLENIYLNITSFLKNIKFVTPTHITNLRLKTPNINGYAKLLSLRDFAHVLTCW